MIIAIMGTEGSGKDTIGKIIQYLNSHTSIPYLRWEEELEDISQYISPSFQIKKFADKVTEVYEVITGVNFHKLPRDLKEQHRPKYIEFAETMKEIFGKNVWVNRLFDEYKCIPFDWVITDLRFDNEYMMIQQLKGVVIHVVRGGVRSPLDAHVTPDYVIHNDGSKEELVEKVRRILIEEDILAQ